MTNLKPAVLTIQDTHIYNEHIDPYLETLVEPSVQWVEKTLNQMRTGQLPLGTTFTAEVYSSKAPQKQPQQLLAGAVKNLSRLMARRGEVLFNRSR